MTPVTINEIVTHYLSVICDESFNDRNFYLKDGYSNYHRISEVDVMSDRICCDDGFYDYWEYIAERGGIYSDL